MLASAIALQPLLSARPTRPPLIAFHATDTAMLAGSGDLLPGRLPDGDLGRGHGLNVKAATLFRCSSSQERKHHGIEGGITNSKWS